MQTKRVWLLIVGLLVCFVALLFGLVWLQGTANNAASSESVLSQAQVQRLAQDALRAEYSGSTEQTIVKQTTVGELGKFHCGAIGAMISLVVSPLQGNPDICAPDSTMWVVTLRGAFQRQDFRTDSVQVILDRAGRLMAIESGELIPDSAPAY